MSKMEGGTRCTCTYDCYQVYENITEKGVRLYLEVNNTTLNPFRYFKPGKLEIVFRETDQNTVDSVILMAIKLTSATCKENTTIVKSHWNGILVCRLKYRDHKWKAHEHIEEYPMQTGTKAVTFRVHYGNEQTASFNITIKFAEKTDIKYKTNPELCEEEQQFIMKRKEKLQAHLIGFYSDVVPLEVVPTIAIIGSGGGIRAVIGMGSALSTLQDRGILDLAMYTAGVSGSAWYMLTMYAECDDDDKTLPTRKVNKSIRSHLDSFEGVGWTLLKYFLGKISFIHGKYFTFTNIFGQLIGRLLHSSQISLTSRWSDTKHIFNHGKKPLPLVAALHVRDETTSTQYHEWIEFSPYQVYIPKYGTAIDMQDFGSEFDRGFVTKRYNEPPVHYLQGVCGSAYAKVRDVRPKDHRTQQYAKESKLPDHRTQQYAKESELPGFNWFISWIYVRYFLCKLLRCVRHSSWILCRYIKDFIWKLFNMFDSYFIAKVPNFLQGTQMRRLVGEKDKIDFTNDNMMLVDAGISINSPYPLVLQPSRQVDIIISFDWSDRYEDANWPFEELEKAEEWANSRRVPFPDLHLDRIRLDWNKGIHKEVYVFQGDNAPTIVHFVMINLWFRKSGLGDCDFNILPDYSTLRFKYSKLEYDRFYALVNFNVILHMDTIVETIRNYPLQRINQRRRELAERINRE